MTKIIDYHGVVIQDKISAEARKQELSENERTLLWDTPVLIETTNHELTLDDTFEITSRYDGRDDQPITFPAVSGQWHVYDMGRFNSPHSKNLYDTLLVSSDSFDITQLRKRWARIDNGQDLDLDADLYAEHFTVGSEDSPLDFDGLHFCKANIHPHLNENGQLDAVILDFDQQYERHAGFYNYDVRLISSDSDESYYNRRGKGGLYELTPETFNDYITKAGNYDFMVKDNQTGYFAKWSRGMSVDGFIDNFKEESQKYENGDKIHIYLVPTKLSLSDRRFGVKNTNINHLTHDVYMINDMHKPKYWGHVYDDGTITMNRSTDYYHDIYNKFDSAIHLGDIPEIQNLQIAKMIAQEIGQPEKEFSYPFNFNMTFRNSKGEVKTTTIMSNKIRTDEQAIAHAEKMVNSWRNGNDQSQIELLKIVKDYGDIFRIENGKAKMLPQDVIFDNMSLTLDDLSDLDIDEQSK